MAPSRKSFLTERLVASPETDVYRTRNFRLANQPDADALTQLFHTHPEVTVADVLLAQLQELIRTRHPTRRLQETDLLALVKAHMCGTALAEYGVWVYYPWSARLVHLLDEPEFVELRTNRNKYKITPAEQTLLAGKRIGIVGLSVGQSVAVTLALERGCGEIRLADFDRLELSNLNRIRTGVHNLGVLKVAITAREIAEIDPYLQVTCFPEGLTDTNVDAFLFGGGKLDLLVEECDSLDVKIKLRSLAKAHRIPVVMDTSDRGLVDVERFDLEPERPIFHGLAGDVDPARLSGLSTEDKIPYVLDIIGAETVSPRLRASFVEIGQSLSSWPQLASAVVYGGAATCDVIRRINLGQMRNSGRYFVDVEQLIPNTAAEPAVSDAPEACVPPPLEDGYMITVVQTCEKRSAPPIHDAVTPSRQQIAAMVADAILAPSGGNCQPWRWLSHDSALYLFHDRIRSHSLLDFQGTASLVALGAAAENLVLSAHHAGFEVLLEPFPLSTAPDLVASFHFLRQPTSSTEPHWRDALYALLRTRHTNRQYSTRTRLRPEQLETFCAAVGSIPGARVEFIQSDDQLEEIGRLLGAGDRLRMLHQQLHRELMQEMRWTSAEAEATRDGIAVETMALSPLDLAGLRLCRHWPSLALLRQWGGGQSLERMAIKGIAAASAVGLITLPMAEPIAYFHGGRAVQRLWLSATACQVALQPMTALPYLFARVLRGGGEGLDVEIRAELHELRSRYEQPFQVTKETAEVLLFRLFHADFPHTSSLRRVCKEVLRFA